MANTNTPFGVQVMQGGGAYTFNAQGSLYAIPTSDTSNAYYLSDVVKTAAGSDTAGVPNIVKAAGTDRLRGTITGILPVATGTSIAAPALNLEYTAIPAGTRTQVVYVIVDDDPTSIFQVQDDGITTANLVAASANLNFSLTITAGASLQSQSATVMLSSSLGTTSTLNMKAQGLAQLPGNAYGAYGKWKCRINMHELTGDTVGV